MTNVALIMKPWIVMAKKFTGIRVYILADDVLIIATGMKMLSNFAKALNATHPYLHHMGAKVAPDKSYNFASCLKAKTWLSQTHWEHINSSIKVITDFRYLGAHLTTRHAANSSTMDKRWDKAKQQLKKLRYCPANVEAKIRAIISKVYAGAMYGVEAAGATPTKVASLTAAVIDVFKSRNNNHNANQFFSTITGSKVDLDPQVQIFARRAMQVRRTACKRPETMERFQKSIRNYANKYKRDGTWPKWYRPEDEDGTGWQHNYPDEQPHPSTAEHEPNWDEDICAMGPIGLLIESTVWHGMKIDSKFNLWQKNEQPISIMEAPYQSLKPLITKAAARARNRAEWHRGASTRRARAPLETDSDLSRIAPQLTMKGKEYSGSYRWEGTSPVMTSLTSTRMSTVCANTAMQPRQPKTTSDGSAVFSPPPEPALTRD